MCVNSVCCAGEVSERNDGRRNSESKLTKAKKGRVDHA